MSISTGPGLAGRTTSNNNKMKNWIKVGYEDIVLSPDVTGMGCTQVLSIHLNGCGKPKPFTLFDFDGTLFDTMKNWWEAGLRTATFFDLAFSPESIQISAFDWETGHVPMSYENRRHFGILEGVKEKEMWDTLASFLTEREEINPSRMFPGAKKLLAAIRDMNFQPVIVTSNSVHDIRAMITREMGEGFIVDVIRVKGLNKALVLSHLYQQFDMSNLLSKRQRRMYFFGDSVADILSAEGTPVRAIGVYRASRHRFADSGSRFSWSDHQARMRKAGAHAIITHSQMPRYGDFIDRDR